MRTALLLLLFVACSSISVENDGNAEALELVARHCAVDLWGMDLCGPMLLVDPDSRRVTANVADTKGHLSPVGRFYRGWLPVDTPLANTDLEWAGVHWAMVLLPLPQERAERLRLMAHESFHRIQAKLGLAQVGSDNSHLDSRDGRIWFRLEARALRAALTSDDVARYQAFVDAQGFREQRYRLAPGARRAEAELELNEGLAEYTGILVAYGDKASSQAASALQSGATGGDLIRRFAYLTGPGWGLLLDEYHPGWRSRLAVRPNFLDLVTEKPGSGLPDRELAAAAEKYGIDTLSEQEDRLQAERDTEQATLVSELFARGAVLVPLRQMKMQFDPNRVLALPPHGQVYRKITIQDQWGEIQVDGAALISKDFQTVRVGRVLQRDAGMASGKGWKLHFGQGWNLLQNENGLWRLLEAQGKL